MRAAFCAKTPVPVPILRETVYYLICSECHHSRNRSDERHPCIVHVRQEEASDRQDSHDRVPDIGVSSHAQIVIAAPDCDVLFRAGEVLSVRRLYCRPGHFFEDSIRMVTFLA